MDKKKKNSRVTYIVLALLCFGAIGSLIVTSLSENRVYFLNVGELLAMEVNHAPSHARIFGTVAEGFERSTTSTQLVFTLVDKFDPTQRVEVIYSGAVPDAFKVDAEVIAEGTLAYVDGTTTMNATTIMAKCPSKYAEKSRQMTEAMEKEKQNGSANSYAS
ncbi:MAG: cytochrome c maturation protein CcmE [Desulfovibrionaceae bacterium]|nr:cytochrome c maturation protein CcmE [Desulfovibrionaceae bacterium]